MRPFGRSSISMIVVTVRSVGFNDAVRDRSTTSRTGAPTVTELIRGREQWEHWRDFAMDGSPPDFDVLIVGAGISGIGAAAHLRARLPRHTFAILEGREAVGGTWDLFRFPGIRSDSDLFTFGYAFKPWTSDRSIAAADLIL